MSVKMINKDKLKEMFTTNGLIIQRCNDELDILVEDINKTFENNGILLNGSKFYDCLGFEDEAGKHLVLPFRRGVNIDLNKLKLWIQETFDSFGGISIPDYISKYFTEDPQSMEQNQKKYEIPAVKDGARMFNLMTFAFQALSQAGYEEDVKKMQEQFYIPGQFEEVAETPNKETEIEDHENN